MSIFNIFKRNKIDIEDIKKVSLKEGDILFIKTNLISELEAREFYYRALRPIVNKYNIDFVIDHRDIIKSITAVSKETVRDGE